LNKSKLLKHYTIINGKAMTHCMSSSKIKIKANHRKRGTYINDCSLSWLGTGASIKSDSVKHVTWVQTSPLSEILIHHKYQLDCII